MIYNAQYPLVAPDFVFSPEDEDFHPLLFGDRGRTRFEMGSLCNWNIKDPSRLLLVVNELRFRFIYFFMVITHFIQYIYWLYSFFFVKEKVFRLSEEASCRA